MHYIQCICVHVHCTHVCLIIRPHTCTCNITHVLLSLLHVSVYCVQWSGRQPPACIDVPPIEHHLKHILTQVYNRSIKRPEELNQYPPFSPEVREKERDRGREKEKE